MLSTAFCRPRLPVSFSTKHHHCRSNPPWLASVPNEANLIAKLTNVVSTNSNDRGKDRNGGDNMRKGLVISSCLLTAALALGAQGHSHGKGAATTGSAHSN